MIQLARHFSEDCRRARLETALREQWFIKAREEQKRREDMAEEAAEEAMTLGISVVIATETQIAAFEAQRDLRDAATIEALNENRLKLEEVQQLLLDAEARIQDMLDRAYVMEDGRRVFLTEDRTRAFDEFGEEVFQDELDFDAVPENAPTYEAYAEQVELEKALRAEEQALINEQQELLDYQDKLDDARERIADGAIPEEELRQLDAELTDAMPLSVGRHMPGYESKAVSEIDADSSDIHVPQFEDKGSRIRGGVIDTDCQFRI